MTTLIIGGSAESKGLPKSDFIGWKLRGLGECPYSKRGEGRLSAFFDFVVTRNGIDEDGSYIRLPSMIALTKAELLDYDNSRACIHSISRELCANALKQFEEAERKEELRLATEMNEAARKQTADIIPMTPPRPPLHHVPEPRQMAAAIPSGPSVGLT